MEMIITTQISMTTIPKQMITRERNTAPKMIIMVMTIKNMIIMVHYTEDLHRDENFTDDHYRDYYHIMINMKAVITSTMAALVLIIAHKIITETIVIHPG